MRILVVEDDPILADGLRAGLSLTGAAVDAVQTCEDADHALAASRYSAVVLDIMLPDGSGLDLLRRLRGRRDAPRARSAVRAKTVESDIPAARGLD